MSDEYSEAHLQRLLSEQMAEQGIDVRVDGGVVTLCGHVETPQRRAQAEERARRLPGVARVVNEVVVAGHGAPARPEEVS